MEDERLIAKAIKGNDEALYELIDNNKEQLYKIAYSYFKNQQDSLEAIQETTFRAYKNIKKLKEPKYFKTWLIRILINYCIDEVKRNNRVLNIEKPVKALDKNNSDDKLTVDEAMETLKPKYKEIIVLKYFEDLTIREISDVIQIPEGTVKTRLSRALSSLREYLNRGEDYV